MNIDYTPILEFIKENRMITYADLKKMGYSYYFRKMIMNELLRRGIVKRTRDLHDTRNIQFLEVY